MKTDLKNVQIDEHKQKSNSNDYFTKYETNVLKFLDSIDSVIAISKDDKDTWINVYQSKRSKSCFQDLNVSDIYEDLSKLKIKSNPKLKSDCTISELKQRFQQKMLQVKQENSKPKKQKKKDKKPPKSTNDEKKLNRRQKQNDKSLSASSSVKPQNISNFSTLKFDSSKNDLDYVKPSQRKKIKTKSNIIKALKIAEGKNQMTNSDKVKWDIAERKAKGEKLVPDQKLKKLLKKQENRRRKSAKQWSQREKQVSKDQKKRQQKRMANIEKRSQTKKAKIVKKLKKKGRIVD